MLTECGHAKHLHQLAVPRTCKHSQHAAGRRAACVLKRRLVLRGLCCCCCCCCRRRCGLTLAFKARWMGRAPAVPGTGLACCARIRRANSISSAARARPEAPGEVNRHSRAQWAALVGVFKVGAERSRSTQRTKSSRTIGSHHAGWRELPCQAQRPPPGLQQAALCAPSAVVARFQARRSRVAVQTALKRECWRRDLSNHRRAGDDQAKTCAQRPRRCPRLPRCRTAWLTPHRCTTIAHSGSSREKPQDARLPN